MASSSQSPRGLARSAALLLAVGLSAPPALAAPGWLEGWLDARSSEQRAHLRRGAESAGLWQELPEGLHLEGFEAPTSLAPLIRAVRSGVVNISTVNEVLASGEREVMARRSLGSGFILSPDGYVVTNNHVIERARVIQVKLADGREFEAGVVGRDPSTDLALLRLTGEVPALPFVYLGNSDALEVGDWVLAIGNPFGLDHSVSHGMISAKERVIGVGLFDDFIQTDTLINPGNSGGPLFNMRGEVIGVTTAIVSQAQGIGFAVPSNMVKDLLPNLRVNGRLSRGWLGVNIQDTATTELRRTGALVTDVFLGSPAAKAGIRPGDRLTAVNGRTIESYLQLLRRVAILAPGSEARLTLERAGDAREVAVTLSERPAPEALQALTGPGFDRALGVVVRELTPALATRVGANPKDGVWVAGILPGSPADRAGLRAGDLLLEINRIKIRDVGSFRAALARSGSEPALLRFKRGDQSRYVAVGGE